MSQELAKSKTKRDEAIVSAHLMMGTTSTLTVDKLTDGEPNCVFVKLMTAICSSFSNILPTIHGAMKRSNNKKNCKYK